jgi:hypothetical protein
MESFPQGRIDSLTAAFLFAGVLLGLRHTVMAFVLALPATLAAAFIASKAGWIEPGLMPIIALCVLFEIGFFLGCVIHSALVDRAKLRHRFAQTLSNDGN